ncbi:MAG: Aspartokinase [Labilithrix sp.]|nr:Aspartokinase [Labilithrix sp.]
MSPETNILLLGTGVVGSALLEIVRTRLSSEVRIAGVANSRGVILASTEHPYEVRPSDLAELLARPRSATPVRIDDDVLDQIAAKRGVLVDATAEENIGELYERALSRGIHVVTANKKPIAGTWAVREKLFALTGGLGKPQIRYEATVGAALPVIETLKNLVRTGDRVKRIDCVLSGTLGFLCNSIADGTPLSKAIAVARERGYTEPDPREDLGGADVARKAVILARELGVRLETSEVALEPFLPREVLDASTPDTLEREAAKLDATFAANVERQRRRNEKLVFLARIEAEADGTVRASAGPVVVPGTHPAAQLQGSSALVAFSTSRHAVDPLVVRGAGAGGPVTASALLADIFAVSAAA